MTQETFFAIIKYGPLDPKKLWEAFHPKAFSTKEIADRLNKGLGINGYEFLTDFLPEIVIEDREIKSGKNKGQRKITYEKEISNYDKNFIIKSLTGLDTLDELYNLSTFVGDNMYDSLLSDKDVKEAKRIAYQWSWYRSWLDKKYLCEKVNPAFKHFLNLTVYDAPIGWDYAKDMSQKSIDELHNAMLNMKDISQVAMGMLALSQLTEIRK